MVWMTSPAQLQQLASELLDAAKSYQLSMGQAGLKARIDMSSRAKCILHLLSEPGEELFRLSANVSVLTSLISLLPVSEFRNHHIERSDV
jgi:hypothetical protein